MTKAVKLYLQCCMEVNNSLKELQAFLYTITKNIQLFIGMITELHDGSIFHWVPWVWTTNDW